MNENKVLVWYISGIKNNLTDECWEFVWDKAVDLFQDFLEVEWADVPGKVGESSLRFGCKYVNKQEAYNKLNNYFSDEELLFFLNVTEEEFEALRNYKEPEETKVFLLFDVDVGGGVMGVYPSLEDAKRAAQTHCGSPIKQSAEGSAIYFSDSRDESYCIMEYLLNYTY